MAGQCETTTINAKNEIENVLKYVLSGFADGCNCDIK